MRGDEGEGKDGVKVPYGTIFSTLCFGDTMLSLRLNDSPVVSS